MLWVSPIRAIASNLFGKLSASLPAIIGAINFKTVSIQMAHSRPAGRRNSSDLAVACASVFVMAIGHAQIV
jgi:hypothetical protein